MALQKIVIDGQALRTAIRDAGTTIKGTAEGAHIGEKTLHNILNGLPIRRDKVEQVFNHLSLNIDEFHVSRAKPKIGHQRVENNEFIFTGNSEITLGPLEVPDFRNFPVTLIYRLDVPAASQSQLEAMRVFNNVLEKHFHKEPSSRVDFQTEYNKLSLYSDVNAQLESLRKDGLFVRFGIFTFWQRDIENDYWGDEYVPGLVFESTTMMAILISSRIKSGTAIAKVNKGNRPKSLYIADPEYKWTKVNGEFLPSDDDLPF